MIWPPDWLPDWENADWYTALAADGLAWEFLRRNKEYVADWGRYQSAPEFNHAGGKTGKFSGRAHVPWDPMTCYGCSPPALEGETLEQYEARMKAEDVDYEVENLESWLCRKWGIDELYNPADPNGCVEPLEIFPVSGSPRNALIIPDDSDDFLVQLVERNVRLRDAFPMRACISVRGGWGSDEGGRFAPIWFDLKGNLKEQLDEALKILQEGRIALYGSKEKTTRDKSAADKVLIEALRVFDARQRRADNRVIAERIFNEIHVDETIAKKIARRGETAQEYIDGGYLRLGARRTT